MLDDGLGVINEAHGINPKLMTPNDVQAILTQISLIPKLGEQSYHIDSFLSLASAKHPAGVIEMLLSRIQKAASLPEGQGNDFQPLPYLEFQEGLTGLNEAQDYPALLKRIRDASLGEHWVYTFWVPRLYALASSQFCRVALDVLYEWVRSNDAHLVVAAAHLTREAGSDFVYAHEDFVGTCLTAAEKLGIDCLKSVRSSFFAIAVSGTFSSAVGQAPPRYVQDKTRAAAVAEQHHNAPVVAEFFTDLARHFEAEIQECLARDEEFFEE